MTHPVLHAWVSELDLPESDAWEHVLTLSDGGGGWEWADLMAFWDPSARRYFWYDDSGCSCYCWGDHLTSLGDFGCGDRAALHAALREFADDNTDRITDAGFSEAVKTLVIHAASVRSGTVADDTAG